jgi:hypothetical protein
MNDYQITLIEPDGRHIGKASAPVMPRFLHVGEITVVVTDEPEAPESTEHFTTFARVVCVHVDDDRTALFVRVV